MTIKTSENFVNIVCNRCKDTIFKRHSLYQPNSSVNREEEQELLEDIYCLCDFCNTEFHDAVHTLTNNTESHLDRFIVEIIEKELLGEKIRNEFYQSDIDGKIETLKIIIGIYKDLGSRR